MQLFSNKNFNSIISSSHALTELEQHIQLLINFVNKTDKLDKDNFNILSTHIELLNDLYKVAERCLESGH